jgi:enoyl-CoA hydratase/carnithine racemase
VTELLVGVPFPAVALELLRLRAGDAQARPLALSGATFSAGQALARGLVDEAVPAAELAGPAHPGTHPVLHDRAQVSRDPPEGRVPVEVSTGWGEQTIPLIV